MVPIAVIKTMTRRSAYWSNVSVSARSLISPEVGNLISDQLPIGSRRALLAGKDLVTGSIAESPLMNISKVKLVAWVSELVATRPEQ